MVARPALSNTNSFVEEVYSAEAAFAARMSDGSIVTWGDSSGGGDSSSVESDLVSNVDVVFSNAKAFAAMKNTGSLVVWGHENFGGSASNVATSLTSDVFLCLARRLPSPP